MLLDFELKKAKLHFEQDILPTTEKLYPYFNYFFEDYDAVIILDQKPIFFIFLTYVPFNQHTHLATFEEAISNVTGKPRASKGEWFVEIIYKCNPLDADKIHTKISKTSFENKSIINFIKEELSKF